VKILVTGADGFVGSWLVPAARAAGYRVTGTIRAGGAVPPWLDRASTVELELTDPASLAAAVEGDYGAVAHLAGFSSGGEARKDPIAAWEVNAVGTARVAEALAAAADGLLLLVSTGEVYGAGSGRPFTEDDPTEPRSPYAASKLAAEIAALEVARRTGLKVMVARSFPHTGRGQDERFVVPAFARRLWEAKRRGEREVRVGNLDPIRDILHVSDVVRAYLALLEGGTPGRVYNVAAGRAVSIRELFGRLATLIGVDAEPVPDPDHLRPMDLPYLVGDAGRLRMETGWEPQVSLDEALAEVVHAQAD
jgi:GDP-4-dehydro-6-deoxy-D-mannose reductase